MYCQIQCRLNLTRPLARRSGYAQVRLCDATRQRARQEVWWWHHAPGDESAWIISRALERRCRRCTTAAEDEVKVAAEAEVEAEAEATAEEEQEGTAEED